MVLPSFAHGFAGVDEQQAEMIATFARWFLFWTSLFYVLVFTEGFWVSCLQPSSKAHENCRFVNARNIIGIVHSTMVSTAAVPAMVITMNVARRMQFESSPDVSNCQSHVGYENTALAIAWAGMVFTAFIAFDLVVSLLHRMCTIDYIAHHVAFLAAGLIIRGNCILPLNASLLLSMEVSTPFLNTMLLLRNRGPAYSSIVQVSGILFVVLFVVFRLCLNTYGAVVLLQHRAIAMPDEVPAWQRGFLFVAIAAGSGIQFVWFPAIARTFAKALRGLIAERAGSKELADPADVDKQSDAASTASPRSVAPSDFSTPSSVDLAEDRYGDQLEREAAIQESPEMRRRAQACRLAD